MNETIKIVISECFGGFGLSAKAEARMRELGWDGKYDREIARDDPRLVQVVEELGSLASGGYASLSVVEIPVGIKWHINEYDGYEAVHEDHRTWTSGGLDDSC